MWVKTKNTFSAEISSLPNVRYCPNCNEVILRRHVTTEIRSNENEIDGWHFQHPCGTKLIIFND